MDSTKEPFSKMDTLPCTLAPSTNYREILNSFKSCVHTIHFQCEINNAFFFFPLLHSSPGCVEQQSVSHCQYSEWSLPTLALSSQCLMLELEKETKEATLICKVWCMSGVTSFKGILRTRRLLQYLQNTFTCHNRVPRGYPQSFKCWVDLTLNMLIASKFKEHFLYQL